jgi:hypothetical protein
MAVCVNPPHIHLVGMKLMLRGLVERVHATVVMVRW